MKMIITEKDFDKIKGRLIMQVDSDKPDYELKGLSSEVSYIMEKRVLFVGMFRGYEQNEIWLFSLMDGFACKEAFKSISEFVDYFNNYIDGKRYHRLLYNDEIDIVCKWMKDRQY